MRRLLTEANLTPSEAVSMAILPWALPEWVKMMLSNAATIIRAKMIGSKNSFLTFDFLRTDHTKFNYSTVHICGPDWLLGYKNLYLARFFSI